MANDENLLQNDIYNRRASRRVRQKFRVFLTDEVAESVVGHGINLSSTGLRLATARGLKGEAPIALRLEFPSGPHLELRARRVWAQNLECSGGQIMGFAFEEPALISEKLSERFAETA